MDNQSNKIKKRYDRVSYVYDSFEKTMESMIKTTWRVDLMKELKGKVLEVGVGTGKNIQYYPHDLEVVAIDFSPKMLSKAKEKAKKLNKKVDLRLMDAQQMDFPDNSFDSVFTTCVFCSVPDPVKGLHEIKRVCKKDGKIILIEHVRSEQKVLGLLMDLFNPLVVNTFGANINRKTVENVKKAGFTNIKVENLWRDIVKKITIYND
ncbi:MAG: hypothetical protein PWQ37_1973 [Candidatus Petromonas sp.]|jgi:ubiquinone/menaquinone biosynthesis C-methylase UbiE|nr:hypothetical protein [Candidatus Petromonas sp.]